ncbi:MAG: hypothetical protein V9G29_12240 [Burkholderiaceae bacterium]
MNQIQFPDEVFAMGPQARSALVSVQEPADYSFEKLMEISYAAGIVDGEGCIHISKTQVPGRLHPTYRLVLSIGQNHHGLLVRVARALEVPLRIYSIKRTVSMNRDAEVLSICDQHAHQALRVLLPHLTRKAPEAEVAIDAYERGRFRAHPGARGHEPEVWAIRERSYRKLRRMK